MGASPSSVAAASNNTASIPRGSSPKESNDTPLRSQLYNQFIVRHQKDAFQTSLTGRNNRTESWGTPRRGAQTEKRRTGRLIEVTGQNISTSPAEIRPGTLASRHNSQLSQGPTRRFIPETAGAATQEAEERSYTGQRKGTQA